MVMDQIYNIENNLVLFSSASAVFHAGSSEEFQLHSLAERMELYKVPGVSIAVVKDFRLEWTKAYGLLSAGTQLPVSEESYFEAASSTKLLTASIALHLVEQGQLNLDVNVEEYLKSWRFPKDESEVKNQVTLRLLLTHQSGINAPMGGFSWEEGSTPSLVQILNGEAPAQNEPVELEFLPGSKWQYSNLGYVVIQLIIEEVLGKTFPQVAQELVFTPLGMNASSFSVHQDVEKIALPHDEEGVVHPHQLVPTAVAHGGLVTTPKDYSSLFIELMKSYHGMSDLILSQGMVKRMLTPELELDPKVLGVPLGQGLGVFLYMQGKTFLCLHPGGNYPGANCWPIAAPEIGGAAVIMTNGVKGEILGMEILAAIIREYQWLG